MPTIDSTTLHVCQWPVQHSAQFCPCQIAGIVVCFVLILCRSRLQGESDSPRHAGEKLREDDRVGGHCLQEIGAQPGAIGVHLAPQSGVVGSVIMPDQGVRAVDHAMSEDHGAQEDFAVDPAQRGRAIAQGRIETADRPERLRPERHIVACAEEPGCEWIQGLIAWPVLVQVEDALPVSAAESAVLLEPNPSRGVQAARRQKSRYSVHPRRRAESPYNLGQPVPINECIVIGEN